MPYLGTATLGGAEHMRGPVRRVHGRTQLIWCWSIARAPPTHVTYSSTRNSQYGRGNNSIGTTRSPINTPDAQLHGRKPTAASYSSIHPSLVFFFFLQRNERVSLQLAKDPNDGRSCGEAGARAAAVQREHRRAHRGGVHPVPGARRRRRRGRAGGAGHQLAEGARHDVPQGRVGAGRVHGRRGPARGPRGGRRQRGHGQGARLLALPEPPLPDHLRGHHVPPPRHRRAPAVARDGLPQAHLGNCAAGHGGMPALLDAGGARGARRPARQAAVSPVNDQARGRAGRGSSARGSLKKKTGSEHERPAVVLVVSLSFPRCSGRPAGVSGVIRRPDRSIYLAALTGEMDWDPRRHARVDAFLRRSGVVVAVVVAVVAGNNADELRKCVR